MISIGTFEQAVSKYFEPIASENNLPLNRRRGELYEIPSAHFVMRIRYWVGHTKSINATLIPNNEMPGDLEKGGQGELGVAVIAGYNGIPMEYIPWDNTEEGLFEEAQHVANLARRFGLPYLLGRKTDWNNVKEFIARELEKDLEKIRGYKFSPQVQKRWHLPPFSKQKQSDEK